MNDVSTSWPELNIVSFDKERTFFLGLGGKFVNYSNASIYVHYEYVEMWEKLTDKDSEIYKGIVKRPPSEQLLDLLANHKLHKFDPPIYDCLLEEYPEIGELL